MGRWSSRRVIAAGAVLASLLLVTGVSVWYWWPREVAPHLTRQMIEEIGTTQRTVTLIPGGSRHDAHTLWVRYHDRDPYGDPPKSPRLLGISLAEVESEDLPGDGIYWVVYSDRVWNQSFGPDGSGSGFGREVIYVDPDSMSAVSSTLF